MCCALNVLTIPAPGFVYPPPRKLACTALCAQEYPRDGRSPLCSIPGFHVQCVRGDIVHIVNLGVAQQFLGSCFIEMLSCGVFGNSQLPVAALLRDAYRSFKEHLRRYKVQSSQPRFTIRRLGRTQLRQNKFPLLKAKAWNTRCISSWMCEIAAASECDGRHAELRRHCCLQLAAWFTGVERAGRFPSVEECAKLKGHAIQFLRGYGELAKLACAQRLALYPLKPKLHRWHHIARDLAREGCNPRYFCCYSDEDLCGKLKRIAVRVHKRRHAERTLQRYRVLLGCNWRDCRDGAISATRLRKTNVQKRPRALHAHAYLQNYIS